MSEFKRSVERLKGKAVILLLGMVILTGCGSDDQFSAEDREALWSERAPNLTPVSRYQAEFVTGLCVNHSEDDNGLGGVLWEKCNASGQEPDEMFGGDCLAGTTYDTTADEIRGKRVSGDVAARAGVAVDPKDPARITVHASAPGQPPLNLHITPERILAENEETQAILAGYGCGEVPLA